MGGLTRRDAQPLYAAAAAPDHILPPCSTWRGQRPVLGSVSPISASMRLGRDCKSRCAWNLDCQIKMGLTDPNDGLQHNMEPSGAGSCGTHFSLLLPLECGHIMGHTVHITLYIVHNIRLDHSHTNDKLAKESSSRLSGPRISCGRHCRIRCHHHHHHCRLDCP